MLLSLLLLLEYVKYMKNKLQIYVQIYVLKYIIILFIYKPQYFNINTINLK